MTEVERMVQNHLRVTKDMAEILSEALARDKISVNEAKRMARVLRESKGWVMGALQLLGDS